MCQACYAKEIDSISCLDILVTTICFSPFQKLEFYHAVSLSKQANMYGTSCILANNSISIARNVYAYKLYRK